MNIPYVIDNQNHVLRDVLRQLLDTCKGRSLDVATAYFTVGGFQLVQDGLAGLGSLRLLLGTEPATGEQIGLKPGADAIQGLIRKDLEILPFDEATLRLVEDLIAYLQQDKVSVRVYDKGFLHAKCWLFYSDRPGQQMIFDRFRPVVAIVGSSNFTTPGLTSNRELNLAHKVLLDPGEAVDPHAEQAVSWLSDQRPNPIKDVNRQLIKSEVGARAIIELEEWYQRQWEEARDYKEELIQLLDDSKFGRTEYTPYQIYMKALYEYFKDDLGDEAPGGTRSVVDLAEFQEDAVKKARRILSIYDGVMIADSVGLGKTWIGKKLLEDYAYHMRQKALIVCPAALQSMWKGELTDASIAGDTVSQEILGRDEFDPQPYMDADVVLIDESHNFRNKSSKRYESLDRILGGNGNRGRFGARKKVILLTATPINNDLTDLYNQLNLITGGDQAYFSNIGIGDLERYFRRIRREARHGNGLLELFNLLEEVVIRRTRPFIRKAYPEATIGGKPVRFPERKLRTVQYDLESTYENIYAGIVEGIDRLKLAPYNLESYKREGIEQDEMELGREQALVGIFKSRYLKRFESSVEAFRISIRRAMTFIKTFESYLLDDKLLSSSDFHKVMRFLDREGEEDDAVPQSLAGELDETEEARQFLDTLPVLNKSLYNLRKLHDDLQKDVEILTQIWMTIKGITPQKDKKLQCLKGLLSGELKGKKVLLFSYYKDTVRYLYKNLGDPNNPEAVTFCEDLDGVTIKRMDSGEGPKEKTGLVQRFAPRANGREDLIGTEKEIDIMISSDVLSEGQNLQDCGHLVNYDLHWNPTRMIQRAGRIDRIGSDFEELWIYNFFPDEGLSSLLPIVERLYERISNINQAGFMDASVLGEVANPQNFNTLRRIQAEDGTVVQEEEQFAELASSEFLKQQLQIFLDSGGQEVLASLPDGIHSGREFPGAKGVFFYFQGLPENGQKLHFWKFHDLNKNKTIDNRFIISSYISCDKDTLRVMNHDIFKKVFELQEMVIEEVLKNVQRTAALETAPPRTDPIQQTLSTILHSHINHPEVERNQCLSLIGQLNQPMRTAQIRGLRDAHRTFQQNGSISDLLTSINDLFRGFQPEGTGGNRDSEGGTISLNRENLKLICFEIIS